MKTRESRPMSNCPCATEPWSSLDLLWPSRLVDGRNTYTRISTPTGYNGAGKWLPSYISIASMPGRNVKMNSSSSLLVIYFLYSSVYILFFYWGIVVLGNYTQYLAIIYNGKECKKIHIFIYITESFHCTPETNTTL